MPTHGSAGRSLDNFQGTTRDRRRAGRRGESATFRLLGQWFDDTRDISIFHDLMIPGRAGKDGERANIDHVVVRGNNVVLIDSKRWASGFYATIGGHTFRLPGGSASFADTKTMSLAVDRFRSKLGPTPRIYAVTLVWRSGASPLNLAFYKPSIGKAMPADSLRTRLRISRMLGGEAPPSSALLMTLDSLRYQNKGGK